MSVEIKVKYHSDIDPLKQNKRGDAIDVRAGESVFIPHMTSKKVSLGFSCKLPPGYFAILSPRSSLFSNHGVIQTNSIGIIDSSYCGDNDIWMMELFALRDDAWIEKNERIGQFILIEKNPRIETVSVDILEDQDRGGYGSSGRF